MSRIRLQGTTKGRNLYVHYIDNNIRDLDLWGCNLFKLDLSPLKHCELLESINISNNCIKELDLSPLAEKTTLRKFRMRNNEVKELDLTPLTTCTNLTHIDISFNPIQKIDLSNISHLRTLVEFRCLRLDIEEIDIYPFTFCSKLKFLELDRDCIFISSTNFDKPLPPAFNDLNVNLKAVYKPVKKKIIHSPKRKNFGNIKKRVLSHQFMEKFNNHLVSENNNLNLTDTEIWVLEKLLTMPSFSMNVIDLIRIAKENGLNVGTILLYLSRKEYCKIENDIIKFKSIEKYNESKLIRGIIPFTGKRSDDSYFVSDLKISDQEILLSGNHLMFVDTKYLVLMGNLTYISLSNNKLTYLDLSPLAKCVNLQELVLWGNKLHTVELNPLQNLQNLEIIDFHKNELHTIDLNPLKNCKKLRIVSLSENPLEKLDITPLFYCQALEEILIDDKTEISILKLRFPNAMPMAIRRLLHRLKWIKPLDRVVRKPIKIPMDEIVVTPPQLIQITGEVIEKGTICFELRLDTKEVDLGNYNLFKLDLTPLKYFKSLKYLWLHGNMFKTINLDPLRENHLLEELSLSKNKLQSINLSPLARCQNLRKVWLYDNQLSQIDLDPLKSCSNLEILWISKNLLIEIDFLPLNSCRKLKEINISQNQIVNLNIAPLMNCLDLAIFKFDDFIEIKKPDNLEEGTELPLAFSAIFATTEIPKISVQPHKKKMSLPQTDHLEDQKIVIKGLNSSNKGLEFIVNRNISDLNLTRKKLIQIDLAPLEELTELKRVFLGGNKLESLDLGPLRQCSLLQLLDISQNNLKHISLKPLTECNNLQILLLRGNNLKSIEWEFNSTIECFDISENNLKSVDLTYIPDDSSLNILNISGNEIQTIYLFPLSRCKSLEKVSLAQNKLSEIDLYPLMLCNKLTNIDLYANHIQNIDLGFTKYSNSLISIDLSENSLQTIDITTLFYCKELQDLWVDEDVRLLVNENHEEKTLSAGLKKQKNRIEYNY